MDPDQEDRRATSNRRWGALILLVLCILIVISFVNETLLPLHWAGRTTEFTLNLVGFPVVLAGMLVFVQGGYLVVAGTFRVWMSPEMTENTKKIRKKARDRSEASRRNRELLFGAWKPGLIRMAIGFAMIAAGSVVINWLKITGGDQMM